MIARKLFDRLTTSLVDFRTNPCDSTNLVLITDESECGWPWNAGPEQLNEWQDICDRTRKEFDEKVRALRND